MKFLIFRRKYYFLISEKNNATYVKIITRYFKTSTTDTEDLISPYGRSAPQLFPYLSTGHKYFSFSLKTLIIAIFELLIITKNITQKLGNHCWI